VSVKNPHLQELGLPSGDPGTRRAAGPRREEVAAQLAISHDYYTRLEWAGDPTQQLVVWSAEIGSATHEKFRILRS
jgi:hypothetical protein